MPLSSPAAERAVLSGILRYGYDEFLEVSDLITTSTFTIDSNALIFQCIKHAFESDSNTSLDLPTILASAHQLGYGFFVDSKEEQAHLRSIINMPTEKGNTRKFAATIKKLEISRQFTDVLDIAKRKLGAITGNESISEILSIPEQDVLDFSASLGSGDDEPVPINDGLKEYIEYLLENPSQNVGIPTGLQNYDRAIGGGLRRKTVSLIGARTKVGKTWLGINIANNIMDNNIPVLYLDTEMDKESIQTRLLGMLSGVNTEEIELGSFGKDISKKNAVMSEVNRLINSNVFEYRSIASRPFEETLSIMRRWIVKSVGYEGAQVNDCVIILDYLKLMDEKEISNMQEYQKLGFMMTGLHNFAVRYDIPVLSFIQLNRDGITKEDTSAASGSDRQIWLSSNFAIYKTKTQEEIAEDGKEKGNRKLVPVVSRHGREWTEGDYINIDFNYCGRITDQGTRNDMATNDIQTSVGDDGITF